MEAIEKKEYYWIDEYNQLTEEQILDIQLKHNKSFVIDKQKTIMKALTYIKPPKKINLNYENRKNKNYNRKHLQAMQT